MRIMICVNRRFWQREVQVRALVGATARSMRWVAADEIACFVRLSPGRDV
jgi:hypothetical protein